MNNTRTDFDFSPVIEAAQRFYDKGAANYRPITAENKSEFISCVFEKLPDFVPSYLKTDCYYRAKVRVDTARKENAASLLRSHQSFPLEIDREMYRADGIGRPKSDFPLTQQEAVKALYYEQKNEAWEVTISLLQQIVLTYLSEFSQALVKHKMYRKTGGCENFEKELSRSLGEANGRSFLKELSPSMSYSLSEQGADEITEKNIARALCDTFRKHAMRSSVMFYRPDPLMGDVAEVKETQCGFATSLAKISSVVYEENADGAVCNTGQSRPGAFFYFLYKRVQRLESEHYAALQVDREELGLVQS